MLGRPVGRAGSRPIRQRRNQAAAEHEDRVVRLGSFGLSVGDVDHSDPGGRERFEQCHDLGATRPVDHRRGLVGDEQPRLAGQAGRDREALQLTTRQPRCLPFLETCQSDPGEQPCDVLDAGSNGSPQTTSSRARTPSTWLSGLWKIIEVPPGSPKPGSPALRIVPSVGDKRPAMQAHERRLA